MQERRIDQEQNRRYQQKDNGERRGRGRVLKTQKIKRCQHGDWLQSVPVKRAENEVKR